MDTANHEQREVRHVKLAKFTKRGFKYQNYRSARFPKTQKQE